MITALAVVYLAGVIATAALLSVCLAIGTEDADDVPTFTACAVAIVLWPLLVYAARRSSRP